MRRFARLLRADRGFVLGMIGVLSLGSGLAGCKASGDSGLEECLTYCQTYQRCKPSVVTDQIEQYCEDSCEDAYSDASRAVDPLRLECSSESDCTAFGACLKGESSD